MRHPVSVWLDRAWNKTWSDLSIIYVLTTITSHKVNMLILLQNERECEDAAFTWFDWWVLANECSTVWHDTKTAFITTLRTKATHQPSVHLNLLFWNFHSRVATETHERQWACDHHTRVVSIYQFAFPNNTDTKEHFVGALNRCIHQRQSLCCMSLRALRL